jgi:hypothetical protein
MGNVEATFANAIAKIHTRFDKGITRYRKKLDKCKAFLKSNKTRKNSSSFLSNDSECHAIIAKIAELEEERLDKLAEQEYLINRKVKAELQKYHMNVKMQKFGKSLQSR